MPFLEISLWSFLPYFFALDLTIPSDRKEVRRKGKRRWAIYRNQTLGRQPRDGTLKRPQANNKHNKSNQEQNLEQGGGLEIEPCKLDGLSELNLILKKMLILILYNASSIVLI